jgi:hypothetical protein
VVLVIVLLVSALLVGARHALGASDLRGVQVLAGGAALECDGTTVGAEALNYLGAELHVPTADIRGDMRCRYRFLVVNDAGRTIRLTRVSFPDLGPRAGAAVKAVALDPGYRTPAANESPAIFDVKISLRAHSATELTLQLAYRPEGCTAEGTRMLWEDQPTVSVRAWGVTDRRSLRGIPFAVRGNPFSNTGPGCR